MIDTHVPKLFICGSASSLCTTINCWLSRPREEPFFQFEKFRCGHSESGYGKCVPYEQHPYTEDPQAPSSQASQASQLLGSSFSGSSAPKAPSARVSRLDECIRDPWFWLLAAIAAAVFMCLGAWKECDIVFFIGLPLVTICFGAVLITVLFKKDAHEG